MSIHGIWTKGSWQEKLDDCLKEAGLLSKPYKYGRKIHPWRINKEAKEFRDWYFSVVNNINFKLDIDKPFHRPSIIAHSLGTWIIAKALKKYPEIKFDKIFLFGSIIPADFDWFEIIMNDQVSSIIYDKASKDKVVPLGFFTTGKLSPSCTKGFFQKSSFIKEEKLTLFGHSDFNYNAHFSSYIQKHLRETPR